jgi:hypothetical protein
MHRRINQSNTEIFQNLENQLTEFMNSTSFSGRKMAASERIAINITLILVIIKTIALRALCKFRVQDLFIEPTMSLLWYF